MSTDEDLREPLLERLSATPEPNDSAKASKKRKRGGIEQGAKKAAKNPKTKKGKTNEDDEIDVEAGINKAFAHMDNQLLADYVAQRTRKYESDLSSVELEDKYLPGKFECFPKRLQLILLLSSHRYPRYNVVEYAKNNRQPPNLP
jgi:protein CMS1